MRHLTRTRLGLAITLIAALAGCSGPCDKLDSINGPTTNANGVDLSTYVAVGTSLSSGFESGGVVDRHQIHSFPSLFARQIGKTVDIAGGSGTFTQPTINQDGIPALLEIKSYSPLIINNTGRSTGIPTNFSQNFAYHNMGIPGAILLDLVDTTHYHNTVPPVNRQELHLLQYHPAHAWDGLAQALSLQPTIMSLEYGANEILGFAAQQGTSPPRPDGCRIRAAHDHRTQLHPHRIPWHARGRVQRARRDHDPALHDAAGDPARCDHPSAGTAHRRERAAAGRRPAPARCRPPVIAQTGTGHPDRRLQLPEPASGQQRPAAAGIG
jgi:hypothetical protein